MKQIVFFIAITLTLDVYSQSFVGEAPLTPVQKDGFYRIALTPDLAVYLNEGFTNFRLFDDNKEVPFILQEETASRMTEDFKEYVIVEKKQTRGCCTSLLLHNADRRLSNNINLIIRNADVTKTATLLGSDDKVEWFALKQKIELDPVANAQGTSEIKIVDFPLSDYPYYNLQINDSTTAPLNIIKAGYFEVHQEQGGFSEVPLNAQAIVVTASGKKTHVAIKFDTLRLVDRLEISMKGAAHFMRHASLYEVREISNKKGKTERVDNFLQAFYVSSRRPSQLDLPAMKTKELLLVIENDDNPPLEVNAVNASQLNRYFTAWLEHDHKYTIRIGDEKLSSPVYDLSFFQDRIPVAPEIVQAGKMNIAERAEKASYTFFTTRLYTWVAVVIAIGLLGFMSVKLLRETSARGE